MSDTPSFIDTTTGETLSLDQPVWRSSTGGSLMITPLPGITRDAIDRDDPTLWRYRAALPCAIPDPISMGEGRTPLVRRSFGGHACRMKLEWFAPTGSFKDRGASVMLSYLRQLGVTEVLEDSSGNGGAAIAAYGTAAGMDVRVLVPGYTQPAKIAQVRTYGAEVVLVPGTRADTEAAAVAMAEERFYASHNWHPFFIQGTKTLGYEIWEDLGFRVPDAIVIPGAAGSNLLGCHLAFSELRRAGEIDRMPRLYLSQPSNCAPVHAAFQADADGHVPIEVTPTIAEGTAIPKPLRIREMLAAIRETGGGTVAIEEDGIRDAALRLARMGLYVEPTCAHAAAGFERLVESGAIGRDEEAVVVLTGSGLKATYFYNGLFEGS